MKKSFLNYILLASFPLMLTACLKSNPYFEDFSSTQPIADLPKATANAPTLTTTASAGLTNMTSNFEAGTWTGLDSTATGVDWPTAVHISSKDHIGDVTVKMKIDSAAFKQWVALVPGRATTYKLLPDSLYTVSNYNVTIPNAGVFSTADFNVHIKTGVRDPNTNKVDPVTGNWIPGKSIFKTNIFVLPISIDTVVSHPFGVASNFRTILWRVQAK